MDLVLLAAARGRSTASVGATAASTIASPCESRPVRVVTERPDGASGELEVILATGDRIRVSAGVSSEQFQRVVRVLKGC